VAAAWAGTLRQEDVAHGTNIAAWIDAGLQPSAAPAPSRQMIDGTAETGAGATASVKKKVAITLETSGPWA